MIDELSVSNLGVIADARIAPGPGLTVITGETGAGKTLLLGALRLLLGAQARPDLVGPFGDEGIAEGRFLTADGGEIVAGRRLTKGGRSRSYLDGSMASASALDQATGSLVEIIGQNDQLSLTRASELRQLVDRLLDGDGAGARTRYREAWERHRELLGDRERLGGDRAALERELDLVRHQTSEIAAAGVSPGEDAELDGRLDRLRNADDLRELLSAAAGGIDEARRGIGEAVGALRRAARFDPGLDAVEGDMAAVESTVGDMAVSLLSMLEDLDVDPVELAAAEERRRVLNDLKRRYGPGLDDVISFAATASTRGDELAALLERAEGIDSELARSSDLLVRTGEALRLARAAAAERLGSVALGHLVELGFSDPGLEVSVTAAEPGPAGADDVTVLFSSDSRLPVGEIGRVASGGELSRLVLALRLAGGAGTADTLVFDEIDAGVGGVTALEVGRKLASLAASRQVLCVTHLPQVAAFAETHIVVRRQGATAEIEPISGSDRVAELTRMLAGLPDSERGREAAEELLALAGG